jgi:hypothetical protein
MGNTKTHTHLLGNLKPANAMNGRIAFIDFIFCKLNLATQTTQYNSF